MMSKKDMLTLGVLAVGGVAVASSFAGGDGGGVLQPIKGRAGGILGSQQGYGAPTIYNIPAAAPVTFPKAPSFDISKFLAPAVPVSRGAAGVSTAGKKEAGVALGYPGYVTPIIPTPVSPGYIPGVTTFTKHKEPVYIPSPVKPPSVTYKRSSGGSKKSVTTPKKYVRRSQIGYTYSKTGSLTKK